MTSPSYSGYRFPVDVIHRAVWIYLRFTLSYRDVEELLAERGIVVSHETVRRWVISFGPRYARRLRADSSTRRPYRSYRHRCCVHRFLRGGAKLVNRSPKVARQGAARKRVARPP